MSLPASSEIEEVAPAPVNPYEHIRTPDETKGVAGGWTTVSVRDVPLETKVNIERSLRVRPDSSRSIPRLVPYLRTFWISQTLEDEVQGEPSLEDIPLPPPTKFKRSKFGVKEVTLGPSESSDDVDESDVKKAFGGFKRKANRGNMRQRTDD